MTGLNNFVRQIGATFNLMAGQKECHRRVLLGQYF